jgi:hypothetical protein
MDIILSSIIYGAICIIAVALLSYRIIKNPDGEVFTYKKVLR